MSATFLAACLRPHPARFMDRVDLRDPAAPLYFPMRRNGPSIMLTATDAANYHRQGYLAGRRHLSTGAAASLREECIRTCGVEIKDTPRRQANNRLKPYLLYRWAAELVQHPAIPCMGLQEGHLSSGPRKW